MTDKKIPLALCLKTTKRLRLKLNPDESWTTEFAGCDFRLTYTIHHDPLDEDSTLYAKNIILTVSWFDENIVQKKIKKAEQMRSPGFGELMAIMAARQLNRIRNMERGKKRRPHRLKITYLPHDPKIPLGCVCGGNVSQTTSCS